ncbi:hypothetical protein [Atopobium fossor]|uniref:hypothetical protein n=1 Tax=Atopobium fossor TaxID=39487 RepID=UPI000420EF5A|nr:hypothetical protein [Atopobium fossor]
MNLKMRTFHCGLIDIKPVEHENDSRFQDFSELALMSFDKNRLTQFQTRILVCGWFFEQRDNRKYGQVNFCDISFDPHSEAQMNSFYELEDQGFIKEICVPEERTGYLTYRMTDKGREAAAKIVKFASRPKWQQRVITFTTFMDAHAWIPSIAYAMAGSIVTIALMPIINKIAELIGR